MKRIRDAEETIQNRLSQAAAEEADVHSLSSFLRFHLLPFASLTTSSLPFGSLTTSSLPFASLTTSSLPFASLTTSSLTASSLLSSFLLVYTYPIGDLPSLVTWCNHSQCPFSSLIHPTWRLVFSCHLVQPRSLSLLFSYTPQAARVLALEREHEERKLTKEQISVYKAEIDAENLRVIERRTERERLEHEEATVTDTLFSYFPSLSYPLFSHSPLSPLFASLSLIYPISFTLSRFSSPIYPLSLTQVRGVHNRERVEYRTIRADEKRAWYVCVAIHLSVSLSLSVCLPVYLCVCSCLSCVVV